MHADMFERTTILLITIVSIASAFFTGFYFGKDSAGDAIRKFKEDTQISLRIHGDTIEIERTESVIRLLINGKLMSESGSYTIQK